MISDAMFGHGWAAAGGIVTATPAPDPDTVIVVLAAPLSVTVPVAAQLNVTAASLAEAKQSRITIRPVVASAIRRTAIILPP
jgi:hypothetical protein